MLVPGASSRTLAAVLADELGESLAAVEYDRFPDDGTLAVVLGFDADAAAIVASTASNDAYVELLQPQDAVREAGASAVTTVIPYMGYARQDKASEAGHLISARAVARAISTIIDRVVLVNPYEGAVADFFDVPVDIVDAAGRLTEPLPELDAPLFLSPDSGAIDIAETVRDAYDEDETSYFKKVRRSGTNVDIMPSDADFEGRGVVITDDIVATRSTMSEAVGVLADNDTKRVLCTTVHPLLTRNARTKLARAGIERVVGTDTIERDVSEVFVASVFTGEIER